MKTLNAQKGNIVSKILSLLVWHPAWLEGYPVRLRVSSKVTKPTLRFNGRWLMVKLPLECGRFIGLLSRLVRQMQAHRRTKETPQRQERPKPKKHRHPHCEPFFDEQRDSGLSRLQRESSNGNKPSGKITDKPNRKGQKERLQRESADGKLQSNGILSVVCSCGRSIELPTEWLSFARCSHCGRFVRDIAVFSR